MGRAKTLPHPRQAPRNLRQAGLSRKWLSNRSWVSRISCGSASPLLHPIQQPEVLEASGARHQEKHVHARVVGSGEGVDDVRGNDQEVTGPRGDDPISHHRMQSALDNEEHLGRQGMVMRRRTLRAFAELLRTVLTDLSFVWPSTSRWIEVAALPRISASAARTSTGSGSPELISSWCPPVLGLQHIYETAAGATE